jgi:Methyltransferase domain
MRSLSRTIEWRREMGRRHEESARRLRPALVVERCPACEGTEHALFVVVFGFSYHECAGCGHLFLHNPPAPDAIATLYAGTTQQTPIYVGEEVFRRRIEQIARPKADFCREHVAPPGIWFDVGCATGELLSAARELGFTPHGCEADSAHVEFARAQGFDVIAGYVDAVPPELVARARVLSLLNLLEHIPSPRSWLERLTAPLESGAHLLIEVPRHPSLSSFSNLLHPDLASRHIYPPDHLHIFTEASLEHVLRACHLEARALWVFGQDYQELLYSSAANAGLRESAFFHRLADASASIQRAIDAENLCDVLLVLAQKT